MEPLTAIAEAAGPAPIDLHFADLMRRRSAAESDTVALTAALLSRERGRGHSCIALGDWAGKPFPTAAAGEAPRRTPDPDAWERQLERSGMAGGADEGTPLVRDGAGRVYLRRYFTAERRVADALRARLRSRPRFEEKQLPQLQDLFRRLFPAAGSDVDWQAVAAAAALGNPVTLISGGPGTGKTTTVTRILALLLAAEPQLRIALAAPTGKAAARLGESIAGQLETLPVGDDLRARIPGRASTIHRLLGYLPRRDRFRRHPGRPLACDLLVIDEASMVDLLLMDAALAALPESARLILLGDRHQLASVETGFVFGDLCAAAGADGTYSAAFADRYRRLAGDGARRLALADGRRPPSAALHDAAVELRVSYRFRRRRGLGDLARAIRGQDAEAALAVLEDGERPDVEWRQPQQRRTAEDPRDLLAPLRRDLDRYLAAGSPAEALRRLGRFRVLCATRRGSRGVEGLGALVEDELLRRGLAVTGRWYHGRPILVTANDYQVRLFNGDLGICWAEGERPAAGHLSAWFPGETGLRRLPLARVPAHATAWAMTVHKSQGSEFDRVLLVLPGADMPLLTRELLYTGVTRAREHLYLVATAEVLRAALGRRGRRASGLIDAVLGRQPSAAAVSEPAAAAAEPRPRPSSEPEQLSLF